jgi:hypothetical protein
MVIAALKTLTWGTIAAAVFSALLLAYAGSSMSHMTGVPADALRARPASPVQSGVTGPRNGAAHEARHEATPAGGRAPR